MSDEGGADSPAGEEQGAEEAHLACDDWSSDVEAGVQETAAAEHLPDVDVTEEEISAMQGILDKGCGCANTEHIRFLPAEDLALHKKKFMKLSARENDLYLCGLSNASRLMDDPHHSRKLQQKERERVTYDYSIMSYEVCRTAFTELYSVG